MDMRQVAKDTLDIVKKGKYKYYFSDNPRGYVINYIPSSKNIYLCDNNYMYHVNSKFSSNPNNFPIYDNHSVTIVATDTVSAIYDIAYNKYLDINNCKEIGVLNFASATHPAGGFLNGATAQEETLAYCSNLYDCLTSEKGNLMYANNKKRPSPYYLDDMVLSETTFFKDINYNIVINPKTVWVVSAPAVNMNVIKQYPDITDRDVDEVMLRRMRKVLLIMAYKHCVFLILGAFGCGVFGNNPKNVAENWRYLLFEEGMIKYFKDVTFAIYDRVGSKNYEAFVEIFK